MESSDHQTAAPDTTARGKGVRLAPEKDRIDIKRLVLILTGIGLFLAVYFSPELPDAIDPGGERFPLTPEGKAAIGLFLLAAIWWVTEVVPIGATAIAIGVIQVLFLIREPRVALTDFMDTSVWFIIGSIVIGLVFTHTGLAKRMAYKMLAIVGEKTSMIYLGCFVMTAGLAHIMAHTAVAAVVFPLFMSILALYEENPVKTKFGKGLFIGMAFAAGAGSIVTLLGAARGAVAISFYKEIVGNTISFFELSTYMFPLGWLMVFLIWGMMMVMFKPEKARIPGLRKRAEALHARLGPMSKDEITALIIVGACVVTLSLRNFVPALGQLDKSGIIMAATVLFFLFKILTVKELQEIPWNIILLFGGAMSIGYCLWQTGAANWMAINWLVMFQGTNWFIFIGAVTFLVLILTNLIMNVAAIAITIPVALVLAPYLGVAPEVILFCALAAAGMPFLFLVGAAPNAIAYESKQFSTAEFFRAGVPASVVLMLVLALFVAVIWPMMDMPILLNGS